MVRSMLCLALAAACGSVAAHHSTAGIFDAGRTIEISGTVTAVSWRNPHGRLALEVENGGRTVEWEAEMAGISVLRNRGVDPIGVISVGDDVTIAGAPSRRDIPEMLARNVLLPSGYEFDFGSGRPYFAAGRNGNVVGKTGRAEADVEQAIAEADGIFRVWSTIMSDPEAFPMFKGVYPLTAAAEAAQAEFDPLDNDLLRCGTKGMPLIMITPFPIELVREGETIRMLIEEYDARRVIHLDADAAPPDEPTQMGFSRGRFEGRALVVETDHIAAGYFEPDGVPQSDQISLVERFVPNEDYTRLDYRITVTDPVSFTEPFDLTRYFIWRPGDRVHPYECLERY